MATAVQSTIIDKLLPPAPPPDPAPKPPAKKTESSSFDDELQKARPKTEKTGKTEDEDNPAPKKASRPTGTKQADATAKPKPGTAQKPKDAKDDPDESDPADADHVDAEHADAKPQREVIADEVTVKPPPVPDQAAPAKPKERAKETADQPMAKTEQPDPDASALVQAVSPDTKQQQPQKNQDDADAEQTTDQPQPVKNTTAQTSPVKQMDQPAQPKPVRAQKTAQPTKSKNTTVAKAASAPKADETATDEDADASQQDDTVDSNDQPVAKVAKKAPPQQAPQSADDTPEPIDLGAAPDAQKHQVAIKAEVTPDDDSSAPIQSAADLPDHSDTAAAPDDSSPASPALHLATDAASAIDMQPKTSATPTVPVARPEPPAPPAPPAPPEVQFANANHPQIVAGMRGQLLPDGGTMHIRLDPPELGALQVSVHMQDGVMSASFQTSNDDATRMLSHSLAQLKHVLESSGITVDKLHVTQTPREQQSTNDDNGRQQPGSQDSPARQEQQRREILQRMWRRLANGSDPLDMVA